MVPSPPQETETATRLRNRHRILDGLSALLESGERMTKLSAGRIAAAAGLSRAAFYLHFSGKPEVIAALVDREIQPWVEQTVPLLQSASISLDQVREVVTALFAIYRANQGAVAGIIETAEYDDETQQIWRATLAGIAERFQQTIAQRRPGLSAAQAGELARLLVWSGERYLHQEVGRDGAADQEQQIWALTELAWKLLNR